MKKISKHRMFMKKQVEQVFYERDILTFAENPFVVGLWCTFQTKVYLYVYRYMRDNATHPRQSFFYALGVIQPVLDVCMFWLLITRRACIKGL